MKNIDNWKRFREIGLLLIINQFLHIFGWSIIIEVDDENNIIHVYPKETDYKGFHQSYVEEAYNKIQDYMKKKDIK